MANAWLSEASNARGYYRMDGAATSMQWTVFDLKAPVRCAVTMHTCTVEVEL